MSKGATVLTEPVKVKEGGKWYDQPFSNCGWLASLRHWVISKIAGKDKVMLNINLKVCDRVNPDTFAIVKGGNFLCVNNEFDMPEDKQLEFRSAR